MSCASYGGSLRSCHLSKPPGAYMRHQTEEPGLWCDFVCSTSSSSHPSLPPTPPNSPRLTLPPPPPQPPATLPSTHPSLHADALYRGLGCWRLYLVHCLVGLVMSWAARTAFLLPCSVRRRRSWPCAFRPTFGSSQQLPPFQVSTRSWDGGGRERRGRWGGGGSGSDGGGDGSCGGGKGGGGEGARERRWCKRAVMVGVAGVGVMALVLVRVLVGFWQWLLLWCAVVLVMVGGGGSGGDAVFFSMFVLMGGVGVLICCVT